MALVPAWSGATSLSAGPAEVGLRFQVSSWTLSNSMKKSRTALKS